MTEPDKSDAEIMQELMPGSTTFRASVLCPCCGWHFKKGLTDPMGEQRAMAPGYLLVCGQCLRVLCSNEQLQFEALTRDQIRALPEEHQRELAVHWRMAFVALALTEPEPKEPMQ